MLELTLMLIIGAVIFYILRVLFQTQEFNYLTLILSVSSLAMVLTDSEIAGEHLVYFIVPLFYLIAMSVVNMIYGKDGIKG